MLWGGKIFRVSKEGGIFGEGQICRPGFTRPPLTSGRQTLLASRGALIFCRVWEQHLALQDEKTLIPQMQGAELH